MHRPSMPNLGPLNWPLRIIRRQLPPLNFITIHYLYFIGTCLLFTLVFWGSSTPFRSVSFIDSLFLTISAMTLAGLNTVNLSELNTFQQFLLFILIILGSAIFVSAFVVHVRWKAFVRKFDVVKAGKGGKRIRVKTWVSKRSQELSTDEELGGSKEGEDEKKDDAIARPETPPARRGGPEMNGISSKTGERLDTAVTEEEARGSTSSMRNRQPGITFADDTRFSSSTQPVRTMTTSSQTPKPVRRTRRNIFTMQGVGARPLRGLQSRVGHISLDMKEFPSLQRNDTTLQPNIKSHGDISKYFDSVEGWIARNSQFHGLSEDEREKLGGCEYRAVAFLAWLVPAYFILWQLLGSIGCAAWVAVNTPEKARSDGVNPWWAGAFNGVSAFNNSGMSLLDANAVAFQRSYYMLLTMGLLILAGNTCYPIFLRIAVWCMYKIAVHFEQATDSDAWAVRVQTLQFLLDHPRRCYTHLFPAQHTWWLGLSVFALNAVDWIMFEILNINNEQLFAGIPTGYRILDGFFQSLAVRSGGFYVVTISAMRISLQMLYVIMMYISVYPVVITMRNSNVYEERSLGLYAEDEAEEASESNDDDEPSTAAKPGLLKRAQTIRNHFAQVSTHESNGHFVRQQLRAQLAHDTWWAVIALFLILIVEAPSFETRPLVFSAFNFIFEVVSAYGCVGISVGVPDAAYSFAGAWRPLSKLILCAVMLRGRHRGLPVAIDKAVLLPGEAHAVAEEEDGRIRLGRAGMGAGVV